MKKHMRRCAQCRTLTDRQFLMQIKHAETGFVLTSSEQFIAGRSIYLCQDAHCWKKAAKNKGILKGAHRLYREAWVHFCLHEPFPLEQPQSQKTASPLRI